MKIPYGPATILLFLNIFPNIGAAQKMEPDLTVLLEPIRARHDLPAIAAAVFTGEKLEAAGAAGKRKAGGTEPVTVNDQFHLGSDTKAMTATLLATFVEQGPLKWDDTLEKLFPDLKLSMNPAYAHVTIKQLMAHQAGFPDDTEPKNVPLFAVVWVAVLKDFGLVVATNQGGDEAAKSCDEAASAIIRARASR